jgi:hypothetical protein
LGGSYEVIRLGGFEIKFLKPQNVEQGILNVEVNTS